MLGIAIIFFVSSTGLVFWLWKLYVVRSKLARRLVVSDELRIEEQTGGKDLLAGGRVAAWLFRAGFRRPDALLIYWISTSLFAVLGVGLIFQLSRQGVFIVASEMVSAIPGGVGNVLIPFVLGTPWFLFAVLALLPTLVVRSVRRGRVKSIEQNLPLLLDLLTKILKV